MRLKKPQKFSSGIVNNTALFLLILLSPFLFLFSPDAFVRGIEIHTPKNDGIIHCGYPPAILVVTSDKKFYLNNIEVRFNDLGYLLKEKIKNPQYPNYILLRTDNSLNIQNLVDVLSIGKKNNVDMEFISETFFFEL